MSAANRTDGDVLKAAYEGDAAVLVERSVRALRRLKDVFGGMPGGAEGV